MDKAKLTVTEIVIRIKELFYEKHGRDPTIITMTEEICREALKQSICIRDSLKYLEIQQAPTCFGMKIKLHEEKSFILSDGKIVEEYICQGSFRLRKHQEEMLDILSGEKPENIKVWMKLRDLYI